MCRWQPNPRQVAVDGVAALARPFPPQPTRPLESPEPFKFYLVGPPVPSDDHELFLTLVYAETERRWNKAPPFEIERPNPNQHDGGNAYQARCLEVLQWIHAEGDIARLAIAPES